MCALNLLVFREDRWNVGGEQLRTAVAAQLEQQLGGYSPDFLINSLLTAGEFECGIADAESGIARAAQALTEQIADLLLRSDSSLPFHGPSLQDLVSYSKSLFVPEQLTISTAEGFAYYALHPLAYADVLDQIPLSSNLVIIGIRSIGTTLSAVTAAAARLRGMEAQRFTVRPQGHPYNRHTELSSEQIAIVESGISDGSDFLIVDEGPGLSGSSFLSVAEALERAGVPVHKIILLSSHQPNAAALCSEGAAQRWARYRGIPVNSEPRKPAEAVKFIGGGEWRSHHFDQQTEWPSSWTSFERLKYLSEEAEPRLYKFAGLGHYGEKVFSRELKVAEAGFGPPPSKEIHGFIFYPLIDGRAMSPSDLSPAVLSRLAEYCAFRLSAFPANLTNLNSLQQMAEHNLRQLGLEMPIELHLKHPVIVDGHMQPPEWLQTKDGKVLKTDSGSHGDDHFFPGPTDIAWDLAGAIVEWRMNSRQTEEFLNLYRQQSGNDAGSRIDDFIKAYAAFRAAYCRMAANAMSGSEEEARLQKASAEYLDVIKKTKAASTAAL